MTRSDGIAEQVAEWKKLQDAVILAHLYQDEEIQELADAVGDTVDLAQEAERVRTSVIVVCGVRFMAEFAKVLNPKSTVLLPKLNAGCSLADSCPVEAVRAFRSRNPSYIVVSYINTSAAVKAESDLLCTAQNAVAVVNSIPVHQPILFLPDSNLGNWVKKHTGRQNMQIWQGACLVHATYSARRLMELRSQHPNAPVVAHPECSEAILRVADFIGSACSIANWCAQQPSHEFIVCVESGLGHSLLKDSPEKTFHFVTSESCNCSECPYQRMNNLEGLLACLQTLSPRIELADPVISGARLAYERMLEVQSF